MSGFKNKQGGNVFKKEIQLKSIDERKLVHKMWPFIEY